MYRLPRLKVVLDQNKFSDLSHTAYRHLSVLQILPNLNKNVNSVKRTEPESLLSTRIIYNVNRRDNSQHRVVFLPEVPEDTAATNPLLQNSTTGIPQIATVSEENCYYGLGKALLEYESAVFRLEDAIRSGEKDWHTLLSGLETYRVNLENVWNSVNLINITTDKLNSDRFHILSKRADRAFLSRYDSKTIFEFIMSDEVSNVSGEDAVLLDRFKMEYKNQGYGLSEKKFLELNANWMKRLLEAQRDVNFKFSTSTQRFRSIIRDPIVVREFPVDLLRAMSADSAQPARGPWSVTLHPYIYRKFMEYCPDRKLRWNAYVADVSRCSKEMDVYLNCAGHVKDIRQHRLDQAVTIGYENYVEMSLATKMAGTAENVNAFISAMHGPAKTAQEIEIAALQEYAESRGFEDSLREYDVPFFKRKQIRSLYGIEEESMREFFPLPHVLKTLFNLLAEQYDIVFEYVQNTGEDAPWRDEVSLYKVSDKSGQVRGYCYLDAYIRDDKGYNGADRGWFIPLRSNSNIGGSIQPIGCIVMSLPNPGFGKPSLISFNEMEELFRQFGKAVAHVCAKRQWIETSGRTGVEWDAINFIPDLMSHWLTVPAVLQSLSCHWSTNEKLGMALVENQIQANKHMSGHALSHELFKAAYDISFYSSEYEKEQYQSLADRLWPQYLVIEKDDDNSFPLHFSDMMIDSWCAGYYSNLWSRMLAADVFSAYWEAGWENPEAVRKVSQKILNSLLTVGSSRPTAEVFRELRGRDPNPDALLISLGLKKVRSPKKRVANKE
eukprot:TRINITY_DN2880_c0_g1_i2.p1 TRINITY_DN2880_c0_g1~~TRINITY_DN2880_c0_g1_i2.p1  ORF type:complete len:779 (-),score=169.37 TRINITY_DN2880_c0_g1_i2:109-2445(-)